jgi:hypothetical protein
MYYIDFAEVQDPIANAGREIKFADIDTFLHMPPNAMEAAPGSLGVAMVRSVSRSDEGYASGVRYVKLPVPPALCGISVGHRQRH